MKVLEKPLLEPVIIVRRILKFSLLVYKDREISRVYCEYDINMRAKS